MPDNSTRSLATLGGGCFWCLEAVFELVRGVESVTSGYAGGGVADPTYKAVCSGRTGHAEVVQIAFDPAVVSYRELLDIFFTIHDPTTLNRQGNDVGTQYRSVVFAHTEEQRAAAVAAIAEWNARGVWPQPIVTEVRPFEGFYRAEDEHQGYYQNNPSQPYCQWVVNPKVAKARAAFADKLRM